MARGQYLRTNYRITGGLQDITGIGGGFGTAAAQGGAGAMPRNGFIYITSYCTSIGGSTNSTENWLVDSTAGILSWYYTSLSPGAGYKFLPLDWHIRSISDTKIGSLGQSYNPGVWKVPIFASMSLSGSVFALLFGRPSSPANTGSYACIASYSGSEIKMDLWGFIVSGP